MRSIYLDLFKAPVQLCTHRSPFPPLSLSLPPQHTFPQVLTHKTHLNPSAKLRAPSMAAGLSAAITFKPFRLSHSSGPLPKAAPALLFTPLRGFRRHSTIHRTPRMTSFTVCVLMEDPKQSIQIEAETEKALNNPVDSEAVSARTAERLARKRSERFTYLVAAVMSSFGITSMAVLAVYYRFSWQMEVPLWLRISSFLFRTLVIWLVICCIWNWLGFGLIWVGWRSSLVWNVRYICSVRWCCCKFYSLSNSALYGSEFEIKCVLHGIKNLGIFNFQVGMEFWARWAHRALWHASLWHMHEVCFCFCFCPQFSNLLWLLFLFLWFSL